MTLAWGVDLMPYIGCCGVLLIGLIIGWVWLFVRMTSPEMQERMKHRRPPTKPGRGFDVIDEEQ